MQKNVLIDYGCHSFTYRLAIRLGDRGYPVRYYVNGSLESPNLRSVDKWVAERPDQIRSITCRKPYGKMSLRRRLQGEIEWAGECIKALREERPSAVITSCVPLAAMTRIQAWCRKTNTPFIYWLQDIQGRAIHDLLGRKLGFLGRAVGALASIWEQQIIELSRMVITIAPGHEQDLPSSVRETGRWRLLENWANLDEFPLLPPNNDWARSKLLDKTRNIVYAGTLGLKHDLETFLALSEAFRGRPDVRIVIVSSGEAADILRNRALAGNLTNLIVLPFQTYNDVPKVLASAAVLVAPLDRAAGSFCVPSKVLSYLCAGRPTVIAIDPRNPAASVLSRTGAGAVVNPGDSAGFVGAVASLLDNEASRQAAGRLARSYAEQAFGIENVVNKFLEILTAAGAPLARKATALSGIDLTQSTAAGN